MALTLSKSRIEALSDGVFAIAMTLLVLELKVPEVMHHDTNETMLKELLDLEPELKTYVITFLIAGVYWFLHHLTFHFIRHVNGFVVGINLVFLMLVSLLPFSSGLMNHLFVHPVSQLFYFGNLLALSLLLNLHWWYAKWQRLTIETEAAERRRLGFRVGLTAAVFAACLVAAMVLPAYSLIPIPVVVAVGMVVEWAAGRRRRKAA